jgi:hypothetical protein
MILSINVTKYKSKLIEKKRFIHKLGMAVGLLTCKSVIPTKKNKMVKVSQWNKCLKK